MWFSSPIRESFTTMINLLFRVICSFGIIVIPEKFSFISDGQKNLFPNIHHRWYVSLFNALETLISISRNYLFPFTYSLVIIRISTCLVSHLVCRIIFFRRGLDSWRFCTFLVLIKYFSFISSLIFLVFII